MKKIYSVLLLFLLLATRVAYGADGAIDSSVVGILQGAMKDATEGVYVTLNKGCLALIGGLALLQLALTNIAQLKADTGPDGSLKKTMFYIMWLGPVFYIYDHGAEMIKNVVSWAITTAGAATGTVFSPVAVVDNGIYVATNLINATHRTGLLDSLNPFPSIIMGLVSLVVLGITAVIAFRIFMIFVETQIVIALSPFSFALLGFDALKSQGFAPFQYLISMCYRIFTLAAVVIAMNKFSDSIVQAMKGMPGTDDPAFWPGIFAAVLGYSILGGIAWSSNSIAASLASGSSALTTSDAGGAGAVAGAVAGAATAGIMKGMSNMMPALANLASNTTSGGLSVSNASSVGSGMPRGASDSLLKPASASLGGADGSMGNGASNSKADSGEEGKSGRIGGAKEKPPGAEFDPKQYQYGNDAAGSGKGASISGAHGEPSRATGETNRENNKTNTNSGPSDNRRDAAWGDAKQNLARELRGGNSPGVHVRIDTHSRD